MIYLKNLFLKFMKYFIKLLYFQVIITLPDSHFNFSEINIGFALSLCSAIFYALNIVTLRSWVDHEDKLDITLYFGIIFID